MAAKAHEISLEAGSKMAAAMKDVVGAAAGLTGLVLESARDLLQYMVRRGQMTQEEADKLMREVEASHAKRKPFTPPPHVAAKAPAKVEASHSTHTAPSTHVSHVSHAAHPTHSAPARHVATTHKPVAKHAAAKKPVAKKTTMKPAAKKHVVKSATKSKPKASSKTAKKR
jgi:polyhydroxyalkanoate synthesis regulator phasin